MTPDSSIFVAGHRGLVGSAIVRCLHSAGFSNLILLDRSKLDLTQQSAVEEFFARMQPQYVFLAAAKVGGILANSEHPAQFLRENLAIQLNVIDAAYHYRTRKLLFVGSSCIYPRLAPQPMLEDYLLTGPLEPTNESYALAKITGIKMCEAYRREYGFNAISTIPTNLYGPGDNFSLTTSHVVAALIRKVHEAKERGESQVTVWGTGKPRRELLHVDDLANACVFLMQAYDDDRPINIGWGLDVSIAELTEIVKLVVEFDGKLSFDTSRPDGTPQKLLDTTHLNALGWAPKIELEAGIRSTYTWFLENRSALQS
jgi:GDP-L-fucose synthase